LLYTQRKEIPVIGPIVPKLVRRSQFRKINFSFLFIFGQICVLGIWGLSLNLDEHVLPSKTQIRQKVNKWQAKIFFLQKWEQYRVLGQSENRNPKIGFLLWNTLSLRYTALPLVISSD